MKILLRIVKVLGLIALLPLVIIFGMLLSGCMLTLYMCDKIYSVGAGHPFKATGYSKQIEQEQKDKFPVGPGVIALNDEETKKFIEALGIDLDENADEQSSDNRKKH